MFNPLNFSGLILVDHFTTGASSNLFALVRSSNTISKNFYYDIQCQQDISYGSIHFKGILV